MNKTTLYSLITLSTFMVTALQADAVVVVVDPSIQTVSPNRVYLGPTVFWDHDHLKKDGVDGKANTTFYGLKAGYDYERADRFYGGLDATYAEGRTHSQIKVPEFGVKLSNRKTAPFFRGEGRLGYTFGTGAQNYCLLTPLVSAGGIYSKVWNQDGTTVKWFYVGLGLRLDFHVNDSFDIGIHGQGFRAVHAEIRVKEGRHHQSYKVTSDKPCYGYEVSAPATVRFERGGAWDVRLEPFFTMYDTKAHEFLLGGIAAFGYNF